MNKDYNIKRGNKIITYNPEKWGYGNIKEYNLGPLNSPIFHNSEKKKKEKNKISITIKDKTSKVNLYPKQKTKLFIFG